MPVEVAFAMALGCLLLAAALTGLQRRHALHTGMLDVPNQRSSHAQPTPRGGGLAIVITVTIAAAFILCIATGAHRMLVALIPGFVVLALVGWLDDRSGLKPAVRLVAHLVASAWTVACLDHAPGSWLQAIDGWMCLVVSVLLVLTVAWATNLFNFMDGIDGIAGSQALFTSAMGVVLCLLARDTAGSMFMLAISASCLGFLYWNWPPARIFMGDVGSGSLGFLLAAAPLLISYESITSLFPWMILWGVFAADASVTLVRRALRRERLSDAHRSHAYQRLSRRWNSHLGVTLSFTAINCLWLAPLSLAAWFWPEFSLLLLLIAWAPLFVMTAWLGAGKHDD